MVPTRPSFLRTLATLRWLAIASQAATVLVATRVLGLPVPQLPLWTGIAVLAAFNVYATWRARRAGDGHPAEAFVHILWDVVVLAWLIAWSGGITNPFASLFLLPIAFAALALPLPWLYATALLCALGYAASAVFGQPLPHVRHGPGGTFDLHLWGMVANFVVSALLVIYFLSRMALAIRERERELSLLRERFARNEGIVALATHAASVAHELNTPLGTMTLMLDDLIDGGAPPKVSDELRDVRAMVDICRDRVRELALPAEAVEGDDGLVKLEDVVERWQLVRPTIQLGRSGSRDAGTRVPASIAHLLQVLLNNAADASVACGRSRVELHLDRHGERLDGWIRDHGAGFDRQRVGLPATLHASGKPDGLGIGLALSHATVERLGGHLSMRDVEGEGACIEFSLPVEER